MRILFIGERSLQNEAILKFLTSEVSQEIQQIAPEHLEDSTDKLLDDNDHLIIIDFISFSQDSHGYIKKISRSDTSNYLVGISDSQPDSSLDEIMGAKIDYHFSLDSDPEDFLQLITEFSNNRTRV